MYLKISKQEKNDPNDWMTVYERRHEAGKMSKSPILKDLVGYVTEISS